MPEAHTFSPKKDAANVCETCGSGVNSDAHADRALPGVVEQAAEVVAEAETNGAKPKRRGRPRSLKNQRTIDDLVLEDPELEEALDQFQQNEAAAIAYRQARKTIKTRIQVEHPDVVNAVTGEGKPRYFVAGNHRLLYQTSERAAGKTPPKAGVNTRFEIHELVTN